MPDVTNEGSPHPLSVAKSNFVCDDLNRQPPLFEHQPGRFNAKVLDGLGWRLRSFFVKRATKLTWTESRNISERLDGKVLLQVKAGIGEGFLDAVGLRFQVEKGRKLRLPTSAPWSRSTIAKARSIAAVIPADVQTEPSTIKMRSSSTATSGKRLFSSWAKAQCVVARRPSRTPASANMNAPVQGAASRRAVFNDRRTN